MKQVPINVTFQKFIFFCIKSRKLIAYKFFPYQRGPLSYFTVTIWGISDLKNASYSGPKSYN